MKQAEEGNDKIDNSNRDINNSEPIKDEYNQKDISSKPCRFHNAVVIRQLVEAKEEIKSLQN